MGTRSERFHQRIKAYGGESETLVIVDSRKWRRNNGNRWRGDEDLSLGRRVSGVGVDGAIGLGRAKAGVRTVRTPVSYDYRLCKADNALPGAKPVTPVLKPITPVFAGWM